MGPSAADLTTRVLRHERVLLACAILLLIALGWAFLLHGMRMDSMALSLPALIAMWSLMMVAMMLPSAAPMILLHARIDRGTPVQRARDSALFVATYLAVWSGFAVLAALLQAALVEAGAVSAMSLALGDRVLAAGLLLAAAAWQLSPGKAACLEQCQSPVQFVMRYWQPGAAGAVWLGLRHGLFCLGCCWSLMLLLFVGGVMNLAWVALLAATVFAEKAAPPGWRISRWLAAALAAGAMAVLVA